MPKGDNINSLWLSAADKPVPVGEVHFLDPPFGPFTYIIPDSADDFQPGIRVRAPFGRRRRIGLLTRTFAGIMDGKLKPLIAPLDAVPILSDDLLKLTEWIAEYYLCERGEVISAMLPKQLKPGGTAAYRLTAAGLAERWLMDPDTPIGRFWLDLAAGPQTIARIRRRHPNGESLLLKFQRRGWVEVVQAPQERSVAMDLVWHWTGVVTYNEAIEQLRASAVRQQQAVELLQSFDGRAENRKINQSSYNRDRSGGSLSRALKVLARRGWVKGEAVPRIRFGEAQIGISETAAGAAQLSQVQNQILTEISRAIERSDSKPILLHGVPGSGKTLIYLEAVSVALRQGRGAIVMTPEISLTPQLVGRFRRRLGEIIVVTHSALTDIERRSVWRELNSGRAKVAIGPRSVVFAPVKNLGLIIVDEEHEESYKQTMPAPRYNGRDAAIMRAQMAGAAVVLGSATPDVQSFYHAESGRWRLLTMPERFSGAAPSRVTIVKWGITRDGPLISPPMQTGIARALEAGGQIIILVNRRGFASCVRCPKCGLTARCPNCDITLRYHRAGLELRCHYCGYSEPAQDRCPSCRGDRLQFNGIGTQRAEKELIRLFPGAAVLRMDRDTTASAGRHQEILSDFGSGKIDILIGTQMVAKGHDFPNVSLVGVLAADYEWLLPDFRALERAFRLMIQAAGRTGRAAAGEVIIQTWDRDAPVIKWVEALDYKGLYHSEFSGRVKLGYPPFGRLIAVTLSSPDQGEVSRRADEFKKCLLDAGFSSVILGPAPPPIERMERLFRRRLLIKLPPRMTNAVKQNKRILKTVADRFNRSGTASAVRLVIDVDPIDV